MLCDVAAIAAFSGDSVKAKPPIHQSVRRFASRAAVRAIVTNEPGVVQGLPLRRWMLEAIAGEFPDADETPEIAADAEGWIVKGGTDSCVTAGAEVDHLRTKRAILLRRSRG